MITLKNSNIQRFKSKINCSIKIDILLKIIPYSCHTPGKDFIICCTGDIYIK